jgi:hypothetical protein
MGFLLAGYEVVEDLVDGGKHIALVLVIFIYFVDLGRGEV